MAFSHYLSILYIFISFTLYGVILDQSAKNYGHFSVKVRDFQTCKGPKRKECNEVSARMESDVTLSYNISVKEDVIPTRGKIVASLNRKPLVRLQMKKPCDHLFMKPLFMAIMNVTQDCVFKKGDYNLRINLDEVAHKYYGGLFLYGNLVFKSLFYSDKCNFSCSIVTVDMIPETNKTTTA